MIEMQKATKLKTIKRMIDRNGQIQPLSFCHQIKFVPFTANFYY